MEPYGAVGVEWRARALVENQVSVSVEIVDLALLLGLSRLIPGDPATVILGSRATPETIAALNARMRLDRPLPLQLATFLGHAITGDLGHDVFNGRPVGDESLLGSYRR